MPNDLSTFLIKFRKEHNLSLRDFAYKIGISHTYLNKLENGLDPRTKKTVSPTIDTLIQISNATGISLGKLLELSGYKTGETYFNDDGSVSTDYFPEQNSHTSKNDSLIKPTNVVEIPSYSSISCGKGLFVDDHIDDYIAVPNRFIKPNKKYFANYASGDSMIGKGILDGDVLVFEEAPILKNGQIGAFCINNEEAVCKVFRKLSNGIILLESANSNYGPIEIDVMNNDCFRVIGKLVGSFKQF